MTGTSNLRGLNTFITDLRNCRTREAEEKRINKELGNIRAKFKEANLDGYNKKKYVCKLLYMYMIGWEIDFGHLEAISLISSSKYSEKQIGYLAVALFFTENHDLLRLVINSIRKDLEDQVHEVNVCLALQTIANIGGKDLADSIVTDVMKLVFSQTANAFIRKKAILCLLRLYRRHPDTVSVPEYATKFANLVDDSDLGVAMAAASLLTALCQNYPDDLNTCVSKSIWKLHRIIIDKQYPLDVVYYNVPCPWLVVKLMRLLQYYPPTIDSNLLTKLAAVLEKILQSSQEVYKSSQQNNASMAIKMEAFNLCMHLDPNGPLVEKISLVLGEYLTNNTDPNVKYLALEAMTHLASVKDSLEGMKPYQETIIESLRDKDISVRRQALDLLYGMCDSSNVMVIVDELLKFLQNADFAFREDLALKIAILSEKFTTNYTWYVDVILHLIFLAGDQVSKEVWYRVVQITIDHEELHLYATRQIYKNLQSPSCHEVVVKVAGYLLGEFGHLIVNDANSNPIDQFRSLHSKFNICSNATRAQLLTTYVKFVNLFPEIKEPVSTVLSQLTNVLDVEIQQRACEYLALIRMPTDDLLQTVCEEMPPFEAGRESVLLHRLKEKETDTEDKRTWKVGDKAATRTGGTNFETTDSARNSYVATSNPSVRSSLHDAQSTPQQKTNANVDLLGLEDLTLDPISTNNNTAGAGYPNAANVLNDILDPFASSPSKGQIALVSPSGLPIPTLASVPPRSNTYFHALLYSNAGVFYEDENIQLGYKGEFNSSDPTLGAGKARISLYLGNKSGSLPLSDVNFRFHPLSAAVSLNTSKPGFPNTINPHVQAVQVFEWILHEPCDYLEASRLFFQLGFTVPNSGPKVITLRAPITLCKFIEPIAFSAQDFFTRWKQLGSGPPKECQTVINFPQALKPWTSTTLKQALTNLKMGPLDSIDPNPNNFVCALVLVTATSKIGCLARIEPNYEAKALKLTVKATNDIVPATFVTLLSNILSLGAV